jgi:membrane-bound lytic murein transglycosylase F
MKTSIPISILITLALLVGCTPTGDSIVRRVQPADNEVTKSGPEGDSTGVELALDAGTQKVVDLYGPVVKDYARKYGFDWRLILAIMKQESRFSPDAVSHRGAYGLMQIMPVTAEEVTRSLSLDDVAHPRNNIRGGVFYLRRMYDLFDGADAADRLKLSLAAYNAGMGRVYDAQEVAAYMHEDPSSWESIKESLPLLSKRYYTLHRNIWQDERPPAGWFGSSKETVAYVESVMEFYDEYRALLN